MFLGDLNDHEVGMLILALKYWRAHRLDTPTRRTDPVVTQYGIDLLLAKLENNQPSSLIPDNISHLFHR